MSLGDTVPRYLNTPHALTSLGVEVYDTAGEEGVPQAATSSAMQCPRRKRTVRRDLHVIVSRYLS
jgi:hypothetical protein